MEGRLCDQDESTQVGNRNVLAAEAFQPILAIVVIQKPNEPIEYFRGVNMEVAMSTGSLCAERNAIGSAFVSDPSIRREYFKMVAVLQMPNLPSTTRMSKLDRDPPPLRLEKAQHHYSASTHRNQAMLSQSNPFGKNKLSPSTHLKVDEDGLEDQNPRGPCGACAEWLKKIAEVNPNFKIVTFSDVKLAKFLFFFFFLNCNIMFEMFNCDVKKKKKKN
ncbi:hypothetical protein RFI_06305 [Reticulomyxa filosa]|uniref:Uncharacterized protein n=1 Tax=Reticulomyxa filosa TaxID=46433 RepID=X6NWX0_RETFI|nr:hypothetical protein RFI_06305 [Reticulomyxa filosa]|eukprot:ETO30815.1 hypothetical protein RFI_06305 [Reticulomyxa filosa]